MSSASLGQICQKSHLRVLNPTWRLYREGGGEKERTGRTSQTIPKMTFLLNHGSTIFLFAYVEIGESPRNSTESNGAIVFFFSYFIFFFVHTFVCCFIITVIVVRIAVCSLRALCLSMMAAWASCPIKSHREKMCQREEKGKKNGQK
jgi:hypothetical protein